ncbi:Replication initiation factor [Kingella potus]|uniref:Replication initiation factor n=2 Tax=Kingella potus TaxID=265175 RepID=A0A377QY63_9NEIS|nr:replication initiation factor domain-containing protein [Kingella potus]STQ99947.1 Replication initiation factor [Kingella potus]
MNADIEIERFEKYDQVIVNEKGELLTIPLRRGLADSAFIDQITFRIHKDSLHRFSRGTTFLAKDSDFIEQISFELLQIFGFGVSHKLKHSGGRFYDDCYQMGDEAVQYGRVHIGGNNDTILVEMTATGCMAALNGWESRLYDFIIKCYGARITRIDLAKDFFNGEYSPEQAKQDRLDGLFTRHRARMPAGESVGTDWESDTQKGKTYYVGSRESSRYVRVYEKGKQLGDVSSNWTRFEVEMKARDIVIPFDSLLYPGQYFCGAYPICEKLSRVSVTKQADSAQKIFEMTLERGKQFIKRQCGKWLVAFKEAYQGQKTKEQIYDMLSNEDDLLPKRLQPHAFAAEYYNHSSDFHNRSEWMEHISEKAEAMRRHNKFAYDLTASEDEEISRLEAILELSKEDPDECERIYGANWQQKHFGENSEKFFKYFL